MNAKDNLGRVGAPAAVKVCAAGGACRSDRVRHSVPGLNAGLLAYPCLPGFL